MTRHPLRSSKLLHAQLHPVGVGWNAAACMSGVCLQAGW